MFGAQSVQAQHFRDREIKWFAQDDGDEITEPDRHGGSSGGGTEEPTPLGSGIAILLGCATLYACTRRKKEN